MYELLELICMKERTGAEEIGSQVVTPLNKFNLIWKK
jgi:hypothetical protein